MADERDVGALPSGTVTFLFTDVEDSTGLTRALGDDWPSAHADHRRLIRASVAQYGGREVDTQGDSFFCVFARAREAARAAADAQRALAAHSWPRGASLRVRMGLHTGEPALGEEGYLGLDVVEAARVAASAHGGEIVVSETTRALLRGEELPGLALEDLGVHRLRGVEHEQRLFRLVVDGLPDDFGPPRTEAPPAAVAGGDPGRLGVRIEAAVGELTSSIERSVQASLAAAGVAAAPPGPPPRRRRGREQLVWPGVALLVLVGIPLVWLITR